MERKRTSARGGGRGNSSGSARAQRGGKSASAGRGSGSKRVVISWEDAMRDSDEDSDTDRKRVQHANAQSTSSRAQAASASASVAAAAVAVVNVKETASKKQKAKTKKQSQAKAASSRSAALESTTAALGPMKPPPKQQRDALRVSSPATANQAQDAAASATPVRAAKPTKSSKKSKPQATASAPAAADAAKQRRKEAKRLAKEAKGTQKRADIDGDGHVDDDVAFASGDDGDPSDGDSDFAQDLALAAGFVLVDLETDADEAAVLADLASAGRLSAKARARLVTHEAKKRKQARKDQQKQQKEKEQQQSDAGERIAFPSSAGAAFSARTTGVVSWDSDGDESDRWSAPAALTPEQSAAKANAKRLKQKGKRERRRVATAAAAIAAESASATLAAAAVESTARVSDQPRPATGAQHRREQVTATTPAPLKTAKKQKKEKKEKRNPKTPKTTSQEPATVTAESVRTTQSPGMDVKSRTDDAAPSQEPPVAPVVSKKEAKRAAKIAAAELAQQKQALKTERRSERGRKNKHAAPAAPDAPAAPVSQTTSDASKRPSGAAVYEEYVRRDIVVLGLETGVYFQGRLRVNAKYRMDGYVTVDGIPIDVLVKGMEHRNRAFDGDVVAIELLPEAAWKPLKDDSDKAKAAGTMAAPTAAPSPPIDATALHALWRPSVEVAKCIVRRESEATDAAAANARSARVAVIAAAAAAQQLRPTAKVVHVLASGNTQGFIGSLEPKTKPRDADAPLASDDAFAYFQAHDERLPRFIQIPRLQLPDAFVRQPLTYSKTMLCFCRIKTWSTKYARPMGEFVKTLGEFSGIESGIAASLTKHGLLAHTRDFASEILDDLDATYGVSGEKWVIPDAEVATRRDFRTTHQIFSIDPYNARDLDDALHIRALDAARSQFEVGVHIADVTHFIAPGSALDTEAQARATSVYLANRVLPMLPRVLCEKLCSLQPQVDRLAFSVVWRMNADGTLVDGSTPWFGKSIIRSCCKLDYGSAQKMLDGAITGDDVSLWEPDRRPIAGANPRITNVSVIQSVKDLWAVGQRRRQSRFDTGAISLNSVKLVFSLDAAGNPTTFGSYELKDSNRLVEEYMLLANYLVAQQLLRAHGPLAFIRNHPAPADQALEQALATLHDHALALDATSPKSLYDSMERVRATHGELTYVIAQAMLIKPMQPAEYMVAGNGASPDAWRHYALNIPYYTHFTSPIRRYADVVVHRLLFESLTSGDVLPVDDPIRDVAGMLQRLTAVSQTCNDKKMAAKHAETECDLVFLCAYVKHHGAVGVTGVVMSMGPQSFTVYVLELGLEERIALKDVGWSGEWDERASRLAIRKRANAKRAAKKKALQETASGAADATAPPSAVPRIQLAFMKKLRLEMSATVKMPLKLVFSIVGECA